MVGTETDHYVTAMYTNSGPYPQWDSRPLLRITEMLFSLLSSVDDAQLYSPLERLKSVRYSQLHIGSRQVEIHGALADGYDPGHFAAGFAIEYEPENFPFSLSQPRQNFFVFL